ncbi:MAG: HgcAB-like fusion protein [Candidatus Asgardarchaeia archaeon]
MKTVDIKYILVNVFETFLRFLPLPCKTGLVKIGNPDRNSPVFLTCNYHLTVERVKKALEGIDCYLLIANSRGINVWCASAGGHLTNHSVVSVLKTSGIENFVDHRNVILPQLAAVGVEASVIKEKTGWNILWGPVYAKDIPEFLKDGFYKTPKMREVEFPISQRVEVATMWAFPFSVIVALLGVILFPRMIIPLISLVWGLSFLIYIPFPFYSKWLNPKKRGLGFSKYTIIFNFTVIPLVIWAIFLSFLVVYGILMHNLSMEFIENWGFISLIILLMLNMDLAGTTPTYKSSLDEERFLEVSLYEGKCKGCGYCRDVCPRNCYEIDEGRHVVIMARPEKCIRCGACIVQCPFDALYSKNPEGKIIPPEIIRKFKLNLIGKRLVKVE